MESLQISLNPTHLLSEEIHFKLTLHSANFSGELADAVKSNTSFSRKNMYFSSSHSKLKSP